jgi:hypothetical protein
VDLAGIGRTFLNPFLAALGPVQLTQSELDGHCELTGAGEAVKLAATVNGRSLSFRVGANTAPTPPMDLALRNQGTYDPQSKRLDLAVMDLKLLEGGQPVVQTQLDQPLTFNLGSGGATGAAGRQPTPFKININQLGLETLRPWLALAGQLTRVSERTHLPKNEAELHSLLMIEGDIAGGGQSSGEPAVPLEWLEALEREERVNYIEPGLWIAAEQAKHSSRRAIPRLCPNS